MEIKYRIQNLIKMIETRLDNIEEELTQLELENRELDIRLTKLEDKK